ncbi:MAG TPA: PRC-barrel domain-containing protein [Gaiellales bacterium]|jgi:hypothetical protein|nr:PRC-barrel domain-containing protein [Gaiellales bacterium]
MLPLGYKLRALQDGGTLPAGDDSYLLLRCRGFTVYDSNGRVGTVCDVKFGDPPAPDALAVRTGLFFRRVILIPTAQIDQIFAEKRRIVLAPQTEREERKPRRPLGRVRIGGAA